MSFTKKLYLPAQAASEADATIVSWKINENSDFKKGDLLAEVESAKAAFDFNAPCSGKVTKLLCKAGDTISFEEPVIEIETDDESVENTDDSSGKLKEQDQMIVTAKEENKTTKKTKGSINILGISGYVPDNIVYTKDLIKDFPELTSDYIVGVTGINERRWANTGQKPSDLAYKAARMSLDSSGLKAEDIDAIILATTTPDVSMPSTACILQKKLGIRGIPSFDINAACSGWLYAISIAKGFIESKIASRILVVGVDMQSKLLDKNDKDTFFLFGDGAGAAIISGIDEGHAICGEIITSDAKGLHMARRDFPGFVTAENSESDIDPWIRLDGYALFRFATESFSSIIRNVIQKSGWNEDDIRWVIPHQANGRILKAAAKKSGVSFDRFYLNIDHVGNTSSASIPLALIEIQNALQKNDKLVLCSVGSGITAAAITVKW